MSKIIENIDDVKLLINKYEWLMEQSKRLFHDSWLDEIESVEWDDDNLIIHYSTYCKGCYDHDSEAVPIEWLFLTDEQLKEAQEQKKKCDEESRRRLREVKERFEKMAQEQKDREEYERLKAKFEVEE